MSRQQIVEDSRRAIGDDARQRVLAGAPVTERRLELAGVSTAVLEAGQERLHVRDLLRRVGVVRR